MGVPTMDVMSLKTATPDPQMAAGTVGYGRPPAVTLLWVPRSGNRNTRPTNNAKPRPPLGGRY